MNQKKKKQETGSGTNRNSVKKLNFHFTIILDNFAK